MNDFTFAEKGFDDYLHWQTQDKKTLKKINSLLEDIKQNGAMQGIGKPEPLKHRPGYSRRIDDFNRLVYDIDEPQNIVTTPFFCAIFSFCTAPRFPLP